MDSIFTAVGILLDEAQTAILVIAILLVLAYAATIERRSGYVQVTVADKLWHVAIEECHQEGVDVRTIDVGIGHDDYLVVAELVIVGLLAILAKSEAYAQCLDDIVDLLVLEGLVPHYALYVEYLTTDGQNGLIVAVATLLGATTCRITLDNEQFALGCISVRAIGQLARQATTSHGRLALNIFSGLASCYTSSSCQDYLVNDNLCLVGVLLQIVGKCFAHGLLNGTSHLAITQLGLCLTLKLRLCHLDADNGCKTLAEVLTGYFYVVLGQLFQFLGTLLLGICLESTCQGGAEALKVGTTLDGVDIIYVGVKILGITSIVHDGYLDGHSLLFGVEIDDIVDKTSTGAIDIANEVAQTALAIEYLLANSRIRLARMSYS